MNPGGLPSAADWARSAADHAAHRTKGNAERVKALEEQVSALQGVVADLLLLVPMSVELHDKLLSKLGGKPSPPHKAGPAKPLGNLAGHAASVHDAIFEARRKQGLP